MFCKRDSDGIDWYAYTHPPATNFSPNTVKATIYDNVVVTVVRDVSLLFPQGATVIEITDDTTTADPQATYGGQVYDATANTLSPAPPPAPTVPQVVSPKQARIALLNAGLLDQVQAAVDAAGGATKIAWEYATEISRTDPLIETLAQSLQLTDAQVDQLFTAAAQIP
jgi:hypothetical protein